MRYIDLHFNYLLTYFDFLQLCFLKLLLLQFYTTIKTGNIMVRSYKMNLPCLAFGVGGHLHLPSVEAVSARPNAHPQMQLQGYR